MKIQCLYFNDLSKKKTRMNIFVNSWKYSAVICVQTLTIFSSDHQNIAANWISLRKRACDWTINYAEINESAANWLIENNRQNRRDKITFDSDNVCWKCHCSFGAPHKKQIDDNNNKWTFLISTQRMTLSFVTLFCEQMFVLYVYVCARDWAT